VARDEFLAEIKEQLLHAQKVMKGNYDAHHRPVKFQVGDWVWLRLHHRIAVTLTDKAKGKLAPKFYGPFKVLERIGALAYHLELPPQSCIHNIFHVVFLKKFNGSPPAAPATLPPIKHGRVLPEPEKILRIHLNRGVWEIMVKWAEQAATNATWGKKSQNSRKLSPPSSSRTSCFIMGGSVVAAFIGKQYQRRPKQVAAAQMAQIRSN
jgi:hypothetical protein